MNDSTSLLDPKLYTPPLTAVRSPFLFTVSEYCQLSSRSISVETDALKFVLLLQGSMKVLPSCTLD